MRFRLPETIGKKMFQQFIMSLFSINMDNPYSSYHFSVAMGNPCNCCHFSMNMGN